MQIPDILASISLEAGCGLVCLFILCFCFVKLVAFITGSHVVGILLILFGIYKLLRCVGTFALYPGCFSYVKADIEIRTSQRMYAQIYAHFQKLCRLLHAMKQPNHGQLAPSRIDVHAHEMISLLQRFQKNLSPNKTILLRAYRKMNEFFKTQYILSDSTVSVQKFLTNPGLYQKQIQQKYGDYKELQNLSNYIEQGTSPLLKEIDIVLRQFLPPLDGGLVRSFLYKIYGQKLYEIRFGYIYWDNKFQYTIHQVESKKSDAIIECAVIKGLKGSQNEGNKAVLFCCPNGAYLQYFALESIYVKFYMGMGYQLILWNYRGYGQSTGFPTISNSIADAQAIYNYAKRLLNLQPEIVHGYSIGGPPAVALALSHFLKTLVVDRSFCNFVNIAQEISPILAKLAKIVMKSDSNIKISQYYLKIKGCKKIMIWSPVDEVISHGSSLKLGVLKNVYLRSEGHEKSSNSYNSTIFQEQLAQINSLSQENIQSYTSTSPKWKGEQENKIKSWMERFIYFFDVLSSKVNETSQLESRNSKETVSTQQPNNNSLVQELQPMDSTQSHEKINKKMQQNEVLNKFWEIVNNLDGAGATVNFLRQCANKGSQNLTELHLQVKSFVLGLVYYGCCFKQNGKLEEDNINNIPHTLQNLIRVEDDLYSLLGQHKEDCSVEFIEYLNIFNTLIREIRIYIEKSNKSVRKELGIILPTDVGHNGQLTQSELSFLKAVIQSEETMLHQ